MVCLVAIQHVVPLGDNDIEDLGAEAIAAALEENTMLNLLGLSLLLLLTGIVGNKVGNRGAKALAQMLRRNKTLETLFLSTFSRATGVA